MTDELTKPFTAEELDAEIKDAETVFRAYIRLTVKFHEEGKPNDVERSHTMAAETASILTELRYQRERIS